MNINDNIKRKRLEHNYTLEVLARKVGVSRQTIQRYESGVIGNIPSDKIELIARALHTTPSYLMGWVDDYTLQAKNNTNDEENSLLSSFRMLNTIGKIEAKKRVRELTYIKSYTENHLMPIAAHERVDMEINDELIQYDNKIMEEF